MSDVDDWIDEHTGLLGPRAPLPLDRPFTPRDLEGWGVGRRTTAELGRRGLIVPVLRGVHAAAQAPTSISLRARALALVVPPTAVITDRTAAWLHGLDIRSRGELEVPTLDVFHSRTGARTRRDQVRSGERLLSRRDITEIGGVRVTTPLRTACDLGRRLWRFDALGALDGLARLGVAPGQVVLEANRFRGYRGVRQLRDLAPLIDTGAESMAESALRLCWYDAGLPRPTTQIWTYDGTGRRRYRLDLGLEGLRFAAEYDGERHHSLPTDMAHDVARREWLTERGWLVVVLRKEHVYGPAMDSPDLLASAFMEARRTFGRRTSRTA